MLKEVIIVEGKMDTVAVKRALECDTIETGGFALNSHTLKKIQKAGHHYPHRPGRVRGTDPQVSDRAVSRCRAGFCAQKRRAGAR